MRAYCSAYLAALAMLGGGLGCASTTARTDDSPSAAARDTSTTTTTAADTGSVQTPSGANAQPVDTFLKRQGTGAPQDTLGGYGEVQRDTAGQGMTSDSSGMAKQDSTSGMGGMDSTSTDTSMAR